MEPAARPIRGLCITAKRGIPKLERLISEISSFAEQHGVPVVLDEDLDPSIEAELPRASLEQLGPDFDLILVLGGDGTILRTLRRLPNPQDRLLLGVNFGRVGFLTEVPPDALIEALHALIKGEFFVERLPLLVIRGPGFKAHALNEVAALPTRPGDLLRIEVMIDGEEALHATADGVLVASSVGATAYAASAGGPIVDPRANVLLVTFICPLAWSLRPLVLPGGARVGVRLRSACAAILVDGHEACRAQGELEIEVSYSGVYARFVRLSRDSFYRRLKRRLTLWV